MVVRKIKLTNVKIADTPKKMRDLLEIFEKILTNDSFGGVIHGGCAKALLGWVLEQEKVITSSTALKIFLNGETDVDMIMFENGGENLNSLEQRFNTWKAEFQKGKISLKPDDVAVVKMKSIEELLKENDLTINEVFITPGEKGIFSVYYTDVCVRDTISETGILTGNRSMTTRLQCGQKLPTNMGVFRLISALVKKRVKHIYIPQRWIDLNNNEAQRLQTENFGVYGLLLTERFKGDSKAQKELMKVLLDLGITDIEDFDSYKREQVLLFQHRKNGAEFLFENNRSFKQIQEHLREKDAEGKKGKEARDQARNTCNHQIEEITCDGCRDRCKIQKCTKCTLVKVTPPWSKKYVNLNGLLCNANWANSSFAWDKEGFYP